MVYIFNLCWRIFFITFLSISTTIYSQPDINAGLDIRFNQGVEGFTQTQKDIILNEVNNAEINIRKLLPDLPKEITVFFEITNKNFKSNGGINGRADRYSPAEVFIEVSNVYPGGINEAINTALVPIIYHEFHHLTRGWAIKDNKYDLQIYVAAINEGLAIVFSENYTNTYFPWNKYPNEIEQWVDEIISLPKNSNYSAWMFQHPDGRIGVGYKAGNFIIRKAMDNSGKSILELSKLSPRKLLKLAGYKL